MRGCFFIYPFMENHKKTINQKNIFELVLNRYLYLLYELHKRLYLQILRKEC